MTIPLVESHQQLQQQIIQTQDEIQQHNLALLGIIQKLGSVREELDLTLTQAKVELKAIKYASDGKEDTQILTYTLTHGFHQPIYSLQTSCPMPANYQNILLHHPILTP